VQSQIVIMNRHTHEHQATCAGAGKDGKGKGRQTAALNGSGADDPFALISDTEYEASAAVSGGQEGGAADWRAATQRGAASGCSHVSQGGAAACSRHST
jgi:hypothetical protein